MRQAAAHSTAAGTSRTSWVRSAAASGMIQDSRTSQNRLAEQHVRDDRQQRGELRDEQRRQLVRARRREAKPRTRVHVEAARHHDGAQERRDMRAGERRERQKQQAQRNEDDFVDNPIHGHQYSGR